MELQELQTLLTEWLDEATNAFQKVPGSAVLIRYVRSSYQNDPVRSAIELVLVIFFIRYLMSPAYSTSKQNFIKLTDDVSLHILEGERAGKRGWREPRDLGKRGVEEGGQDAKRVKEDRIGREWAVDVE